MKCSIFPILCAALFSSGFGFGQEYNSGTGMSNLSVSFKTASESLGKMGLGIERVENRDFGGRAAVAVPRGAILEEGGKAFVVVLDAGNPAKSERLEVSLGDRSGDYVQARKGVSAGDYVVVRKQEIASRVEAIPTRIAEPATPIRIAEPMAVAQAPAPAAKPLREFGTELQQIQRQDFANQNRGSNEVATSAPRDDRYYANERIPEPTGKACDFCNVSHEVEVTPAPPSNFYPSRPIQSTWLEKFFDKNPLRVLFPDDECESCEEHHSVFPFFSPPRSFYPQFQSWEHDHDHRFEESHFHEREHFHH